MGPLLAALALILIGAKLSGALFERFRQPAVLGELLAGIAIGNLGLFGIHGLESVRHLPALETLAELGALLLLFEVGLESDVRRMMAVGASSFVVAVLGVVAPMILGFLVTRVFFPDHASLTAWFVGATLCATSVGITARVLGDLGRATGTEGRIILGAAVIDDVLGLIVLAAVSGMVSAADQGVPFDALSILLIVGRAVAFLAGAIALGGWVARFGFGAASKLEARGLLIVSALAFCFALAFLATLAGLAPIVGAFAAGLVLDDVHVAGLRARDAKHRDLPELLEPLTSFLVPVFFALMGMRVDLATLGQPGVPLFALALTAAAVIGKQVCGLGVLEKGADRLAVGLGMIPRGEVGLIFAGIGATLLLKGERVITPEIYSAVVIMVALTTLMTPPLLVARMRRVLK